MLCSPVCGFERRDLDSDGGVLDRIPRRTSYKRPALLVIVHGTCIFERLSSSLSFEIASAGELWSKNYVCNRIVSVNGGGDSFHFTVDRNFKFNNLILFMFHIFKDHFSIVRLHLCSHIFDSKKWRIFEIWEALHLYVSFWYHLKLTKFQCSFKKLLIFHFSRSPDNINISIVYREKWKTNLQFSERASKYRKSENQFFNRNFRCWKVSKKEKKLYYTWIMRRISN